MQPPAYECILEHEISGGANRHEPRSWPRQALLQLTARLERPGRMPGPFHVDEPTVFRNKELTARILTAPLHAQYPMAFVDIAHDVVEQYSNRLGIEVGASKPAAQQAQQLVLQRVVERHLLQAG